jgi:hypothetical protein
MAQGFEFALRFKTCYNLSMKTCSGCKRDLTLDNFSKNKSKRDGLNTKCKFCQKEYYKTYYSGDKEQTRLRNRNADFKAAAKELIRTAKDVPCTDCGNSYPHYVMDFDHLDPSIKEAGVASMINCGSLEKIRTEIAKCEVVCANCHRERTHNGVRDAGLPL